MGTYYEQYKEIDREIYRCFDYIIDMFNQYKYSDNTVYSTISEIMDVKNGLHNIVKDSNDKNEVLDAIKYKAPQQLKKYQTMFNNKYASAVYVRDVFNISKLDLSNAMSILKRELNKCKSDLNDYVRSKAGNDHFRYAVGRAKSTIEEMNEAIKEFESKESDLRKLDNKKISVQGFEIMNIKVNEQYYQFLLKIKKKIEEYKNKTKSILSSLPH
ncbi:MAG: hypothetical protein K5925_01030 [Bacilli bacterium]|nr:hypothetical protein [Bacilli bacterium]